MLFLFRFAGSAVLHFAAVEISDFTPNKHPQCKADVCPRRENCKANVKVAAFFAERGMLAPSPPVSGREREHDNLSPG
jgi:hypothetical protein